MKRLLALSIVMVFCTQMVLTQTPQKPPQEPIPEDIIRITTQLVQTDVVVTDKNDQIIKDLKLEDFEVYDNGKKQDLRFMEFVGIDSARRVEGSRPTGIPVEVEPTGNTGVSARDLKRVVAFVIDDLTMEIQDLQPVRKMLLDFVDNKMQPGDLVAIVRVVGGKGLLQQFTSDKQLLRRAIAAIRLVVHPFSASEKPDDAVLTVNPLGVDPIDSPSAAVESMSSESPEIFSASDDQIRYFRGLSALTTANFVIDSLRTIPGRKSLVLVTGGISLFETNNTGNFNITGLLSQLTDNAFRAGVVVNALDPRGMRATPGVVGFQATPARSALGGSDPNDFTFGRGGVLDQAAFGALLAGGNEHQGLGSVAKLTGGISVVNTNNFEAGLDKVLARSAGYYTLAYTPSQKFDNKYHKLEIKVSRGGARVYNHNLYYAREERNLAPRTKEESIAAAARSPLVKNDIDVTPNIAVKLMPGKAAVEINMQINASKLQLAQSGDRYTGSFDVVGLVFDQAGRRRGGFSETINLNLSKPEYDRAQKEGLTYSASTELPPDYYQVRVVVREAETGNLGSFSKYLEIPDLSKGKLAMSSVFLLGVEPGRPPVPLTASRLLHRHQDLRYVAMVYNPKLRDGKPQLTSQMIISQDNKVLFREPEQPLPTNGSSPVTKMGQLALAKVAPGRYVLTLVITDTLADKKTQRMAHSIDFNVVN
jgi:VWFA-related protein